MERSVNTPQVDPINSLSIPRNLKLLSSLHYDLGEQVRIDASQQRQRGMRFMTCLKKKS